MNGTAVENRTETVEQELFLLCGRSRLDERARERLRTLLDRTLDWSTILRLVDRHHTHALLYHHLIGTAATEQVPTEVLADLRSRYFHIAAHNLTLVTELTTLFRALEDAGAPAVAWKGPVLAYSVYPSPELRIFTDLDIMVRRRDIGRAREVLRRRGYKTIPKADVTEDQQFEGSGRDVTMWHPEIGVQLDVHWGSIKRYYTAAMDCERLWPRHESLQVEDSTIRALEPDTLILALTLHAARHRPFPWPALKWVTDLEAFLHVHPTERWEPLVRRAEELGCRRRLLLGLLLANDLLGAHLPPAVEDALREDPAVEQLVPEIRARMVAPGSALFTFPERLRFDLAARERRRDRIAYQVARLLTPTKGDVHEPPLSLDILRVPRRLLRLGRRYLLNPSRGKEFLLGGAEVDDPTRRTDDDPTRPADEDR